MISSRNRGEKKMKIAVTYLMVVLMCVSCRDNGPDSQSPDNALRRDRRIDLILKKHYTGFAYAFEARGPLTIAQFEEELIRSYEEWSKLKERVYGPVKGFADSELGKDCARFKREHRERDELYFFKSDLRSWSNLNGREGYVLIRKNELIDLIVTVIN